MTRVSFLLDEDMPAVVGDTVLAREPSIVVHHVGESPDFPPEGTLDPQILIFAEVTWMAVVTFDKRTMRDHAIAHIESGRHTWGVFVFPKGHDLSPGRIAEELEAVWGASEAEEWMDQVVYLPFGKGA